MQNLCQSNKTFAMNLVVMFRKTYRNKISSIIYLKAFSSLSIITSEYKPNSD